MLEERVTELENTIITTIAEIEGLMTVIAGIENPSKYDEGFFDALKRCRNMLKYEN